MKIENIIIYCDGACSGNQFSDNVGGWGAVLKFGGKIKEICGGENKHPTNEWKFLLASRR